MKKFRIGCDFGYYSKSIELSEKQWINIKKGKEFKKKLTFNFEDKIFTYKFHNNPLEKKFNLVVSINNDHGYIFTGDFNSLEVCELDYKWTCSILELFKKTIEKYW